jgi:hypothetical protein
MFGIKLFKNKSAKPSKIILASDQYMDYNGVRVHWVTGDALDWGRSNLFHAWGSCLDKAGQLRVYQLHGIFNSKTRELKNINVPNDPNNFYHCQETFEMLTE